MKFIANISMCDASFYVPLAQAAEAAGFDTIAVPDSIAYPKESSSTYPYNFDGTREFLENKPFIEPIVAISAMAAVTSTIEFHTFVLKMPIRHPVLYAKEATSLAVLSDNRFVLGVGSSPWPDDYEIVQLPWEGRGRRFDECIEIVRGLAAGGYFTATGTTGAPVPPVTGSGVADRRNVYRPSAAQSAASSSRFQFWPWVMPISTRWSACTGRGTLRSNSTHSNVGLSVATAATSWSWNQSTLCIDGPAFVDA